MYIHILYVCISIYLRGRPGVGVVACLFGTLPVASRASKSESHIRAVSNLRPLNPYLKWWVYQILNPPQRPLMQNSSFCKIHRAGHCKYDARLLASSKSPLAFQESCANQELEI